jgi:predicted PurR-regulated permease PerM
LLGGRRWLASAIVTVLIIVLVAAPLAFLGISLVQQAQVAYKALEDSLGSGIAEGPAGWVVANAQDALGEVGIRLSPDQIKAVLARASEALQAGAIAAGGSLLSNLLGLVVHFSVLLMIVFYLLVEMDRLRDFVFKLSPLPQEQEELLATKFRAVARGTLVGNGVGSVGQGALCGIAMWVVGLPSPLFWATVMSVLAFLPLVGVSIVAVPMAIYLFFVGDPMYAALFLAFCLGQAAVFENIVKTKMIGAGAAMPDLLAFLAIVGGLGVFGVLGLLYGPLIATAFLTLTDLYFTSYHPALALSFVGKRS